MHKSRSEQLFDTALKHVTPFFTTTAQPFAIVPHGLMRSEAWPLYSRRFREYLAKAFFNETSLYPGCHALNSAIAMLSATGRYSQLPASHVFTRLGCTGDPRRPRSIVIHLANNDKDDILQLFPADPPRLPDRLPGSLSSRLPSGSSPHRPPSRCPTPSAPPPRSPNSSKPCSPSEAPPSIASSSGSSPPFGPLRPTPRLSSVARPAAASPLSPAPCAL